MISAHDQRSRADQPAQGVACGDRVDRALRDLRARLRRRHRRVVRCVRGRSLRWCSATSVARLHARARAYAGVLVVGAGSSALGTTVSEQGLSATLMAVVASRACWSAAPRWLLRGERDDHHPRVRARGDGARTRQPDHGTVSAGCSAWPSPLDRRAGAVAGSRSDTVTRRAAADVADALATVLTQPTDDARTALAVASSQLDEATGAVFRPAGARLTTAPWSRWCVNCASRCSSRTGSGRHPTRPTVRSATPLPPPSSWSARALRPSVATVDVGSARARPAPCTPSTSNAGCMTPWRPPPAAVIERFDAEFPARRCRCACVLAVEREHGDASAVRGSWASMSRSIARGGSHVPHVPGGQAWRSAADLTPNHLTLDSVRCRAALRTAVGLAVAVAIGKAFDIDHAFWVVLGTLSVLRSMRSAPGSPRCRPCSARSSGSGCRRW